MFKKGVYLLLVVGLAISVGAGCVSTLMTRQVPGSYIGGLSFDELTRDQYEIMGTVEGTGEAKCYLNFIWRPKDLQEGIIARSLALAPPSPARGISAALGGVTGSTVTYNKAYQIALYNALTKVPEADMVLPTSATLITKGGIFVTTYTATVKCRALKLRSDKELGRKPWSQPN